MSLTLTDGLTALELPADLYWSDEFSWTPVTQSTSRTLTGANIVQRAALLSGRPITLSPEDDSSAWLTRAALDQLYAWAASLTASLTLTGLRGASRSVLLTAIEARPVKHQADVDPGDFYIATIRLMET